jgi:hypothetical protein
VPAESSAGRAVCPPAGTASSPPQSSRSARLTNRRESGALPDSAQTA